MIHLLVNDENPDASASNQTKFGGRPSAPFGNLNWPVCATCSGYMQFLGQLRATTRLGEQLFLLFMCQNDPGLCEDWDANAGGNCVIPVADNDLALVAPPTSGVTTRDIRHGITVVAYEASSYDNARTEWAASVSRTPRHVVGQLDGEPSWIQGDEIPICSSCSQPMDFLAQLEQGPDWKTEMNFGGGGCAYVFVCVCAGTSAKLLWQC